MNQSVVQAGQASFRNRGWRILAGSECVEALRAGGLDDPGALSSRELGHPVTDHRSSWVRKVVIGAAEVFVKTYDYPTWKDRFRGALRTTAGAKTRARREWDALWWLRERGFEAPLPWLVAERRSLGFARRAVLVTEAWPGEPLDRLLPRSDAATTDRILRAVEQFVERLHRAGFRDRNLDLRNLLARATGDRIELTKIDSPRHRIVPATAPTGTPHDTLARADWERLYRSIVTAGLTPTTADRS